LSRPLAKVRSDPRRADRRAIVANAYPIGIWGRLESPVRHIAGRPRHVAQRHPLVVAGKEPAEVLVRSVAGEAKTSVT
jgi:hypothetical protein